jgi:hypothetical protein
MLKVDIKWKKELYNHTGEYLVDLGGLALEPV